MANRLTRRLVPVLLCGAVLATTMMTMPPPRKDAPVVANPVPTLTTVVTQAPRPTWPPVLPPTTPPVATAAVKTCFEQPPGQPTYYAYMAGKESKNAFGPPAPKLDEAKGMTVGSADDPAKFTVWLNPTEQTADKKKRLCEDWAILRAYKERVDGTDPNVDYANAAEHAAILLEFTNRALWDTAFSFRVNHKVLVTTKYMKRGPTGSPTIHTDDKLEPAYSTYHAVQWRRLDGKVMWLVTRDNCGDQVIAAIDNLNDMLIGRTQLF